MTSNLKVNVLKKLFLNAVNTVNFQSDFELFFGNNAAVLRPKNKDLRMLCIKAALKGTLKDLAPIHNEGSLSQDEKEIFESIFSEEGVLTFSVLRDIENYRQIIKHKELKPFVPKFYYWETEKENEFIIMDFIEGEIIERIIVSQDENPHSGPLALINSQFERKGFHIIDRLEAIYNPHNNTYIVIDLGSFISE